MTDNDIRSPAEAQPANHRLYATLFGIAALFLVSLLAGFIVGSLDGGGVSTTSVAIITVLALAAAGTCAAGWLHWRKASREPEAASARKSRTIYLFSIGVGIVLGIYFIVTNPADPNAWFSNDPVSDMAAIGAIIIWVVLTPIITLLWWRTTDEHEIASYSAGAATAFHAYIFAVPTWWMATRAGWLPQQDPMIVWIAAMVIWSIVWIYKKYA